MIEFIETTHSRVRIRDMDEGGRTREFVALFGFVVERTEGGGHHRVRLGLTPHGDGPWLQWDGAGPLSDVIAAEDVRRNRPSNGNG